MDNIAKYKLLNYKEIENLTDDSKVTLCYDANNNRMCVKRIIDTALAEVYKNFIDIKTNFLPEIYDMFECDNNYIVIEKYINGKTNEDIINENGTLDEKKAIKYTLDIAKGLSLIHSKNIIHRDISPDNVIIDENDNAVLLDFDIARFGNKNKSTDTTILGTAGFASPEQFGFAQTDFRSDIYSLGVLLNYMLTGHILQKGIYDKDKIAVIINKATRLDPTTRYNDILEFYADLEKAFKNIGKKSGICMILFKFSILCYVIMILDFLFSSHSLADFIFYTSSSFVYFTAPAMWFGGKWTLWKQFISTEKIPYIIRIMIAIVLYIIFVFIMTDLIREIKY